MPIGGLAAIEETGVPVVDNFVGGVPFGVFDNYTLYKLPTPVDRTSVPSATWDELASLLEDRVPDYRAQWLVVHYVPIGSASVAHTAIFDTLAEQFKKVDSAMAVAELNLTDRVVLIRKKDKRGIPDLSIACMSHKVWSFTRGNNASHKKVVHTFSQCCARSRTNL